MAKTKTKPAEAEEGEVEDLELEELSEDAAEEAPAKGKGKAAEEPEFGVQQLCDLIQKKLGVEYKPKDVRTLLRKMAREDKPRIEREIIPGNKSRYSWSGPNDPEVKAVLAAVKGGEVEQGKKEALDRLKEQGAARKAEKAAAADGKKGKGKGKK